jgi:hypothetical protein
MPPRATFRRSITALVGAWFALFSAVAPVAVPCSMAHGAPGSSAAASDAVRAPAEPLLGAHAGHASPGGAAGDSQPADAPAPFHHCDCATTCSSAPTAVLPELPASVASVTTAPSVNVRRQPPLVFAASRTRLLPFAQGPPA